MIYLMSTLKPNVQVQIFYLLLYLARRTVDERAVLSIFVQLVMDMMDKCRMSIYLTSFIDITYD